VQPEITPAAIALVGLVVALFLHDLVSLEKNRRLLVVQGLVFAAGATLIVYPEIARHMAHAVGIGRGVDFVMYPLVIWLVRESLLTRRRRHDDEVKMTELVRAVAAANARVVPPPPQGASSERAPAQSSEPSAS
jgi:hypothetical protein